jgi:hypothetical protein
MRSLLFFLFFSSSAFAQNRLSAGAYYGISNPQNEIVPVSEGHPSFSARNRTLSDAFSIEVDFTINNKISVFGGYRALEELSTSFEYIGGSEDYSIHGGWTQRGNNESTYLGVAYNILKPTEKGFMLGPLIGLRYFFASERRANSNIHSLSSAANQLSPTYSAKYITSSSGGSGTGAFGGLAIKYLTTEHHIIQFRALYNHGFSELQRTDADFNFGSSNFKGAVIAKGSFVALEMGVLLFITE